MSTSGVVSTNVLTTLSATAPKTLSTALPTTKTIPVNDVMNTRLVVGRPSDSLLQTIAVMSERKLSCIVIVDDVNSEPSPQYSQQCPQGYGQPLGIITERDLSRLLHNSLRGNCTGTESIATVMSVNLICITPETSLADAFALSRSWCLRHLPVVDHHNQLVGLITQTDMLSSYLDTLAYQADLEVSLVELQQLSLEDPLMHIGNRRAMEVELIFVQADAVRHKKTYAVALIDIDYFKRYNDCYGHQAGDNALQQVADIVQKNVRESDRVFRYGGEEILILMQETDLHAATECIERARVAIEASRIEHRDVSLGILTVSGGVSAGQSAPWRTLVQQADTALYQAKGNGRNCIVAG